MKTAIMCFKGAVKILILVEVFGFFVPPLNAQNSSKKFGDIPELQWRSESILTNGNYNFHRKVTNKTGEYLYVNWPLAGCNGWVSPTTPWERTVGPYLDQTTEDGLLEYTLAKKYEPTTVYRGKGEPASKNVFTLVKGKFALDGADDKTFKVNLLINSVWEKRGDMFIYQFNIQNKGDRMFVNWDLKPSEFSGNQDQDIPYEPFEMVSETGSKSFTAISSAKPEAIERDVTIQNEDGISIAKTKALLFVPGKPR